MKNQNKDFEQDFELLDIILTIWKKKVLIIIFTLFGLLLSGIHYYFTMKNNINETPLYESKIFFSIDYLPAFYSNHFAKEELYKDFERFFYSKDVFDVWDLNNKDSYLFETFGNFKFDSNGYFQNKNEHDPKIFINYLNKEYLITILTNNKNDIFKVYDYAKSVSDLIDDKFIAKYELILKRIEKIDSSSDLFSSLTNIIQSIDNEILINNLKNNGNIMKVTKPTIPIDKIHNDQHSFFNYLFFTLLGTIFGIFYIFIAKAFIRKK